MSLYGIPVPINAFPLVHFNKSCAVASANFVGLDNGKIIGRSVCFNISFTASSVNAPV